MTQTNPLPINPLPTQKSNTKKILIVVAIILIILIAVGVVFSKNLISASKPSKDANSQQTALTQLEKKPDSQSTLNQANQPQSDARPINEDEKYLDNLLTSRPDADRYEELLR